MYTVAVHIPPEMRTCQYKNTYVRSCSDQMREVALYSTYMYVCVQSISLKQILRVGYMYQYECVFHTSCNLDNCIPLIRNRVHQLMQRPSCSDQHSFCPACSREVLQRARTCWDDDIGAKWLTHMCNHSDGRWGGGRGGMAGLLRLIPWTPS